MKQPPIESQNPINAIIKINSFNHVGMVVKNIDQSTQEMWKNFGIGPWKIYIYEPDQIKDLMYYGKPSNAGMKFAIAQVGHISLGLVESIGQDNVYYDFSKKYGEGIQHLGNYEVSSEADFFTTIRNLEAAGFPCIWSGSLPGWNRFAYIDASKVLHTLLEIVWIDQAASIPQPNYVFPKSLK